nr:hypothetical protein GCM10020241_09070 [Streptoalloteichus tenebrarius]
MINGKLVKVKTDVAWHHLRPRRGPWKTVCDHFSRGWRAGSLDDAGVEGEGRLTVSAGGLGRSSIAPAHQHASDTHRTSAYHTEGRTHWAAGTVRQADHALGRSGGGPTTMIPLACDGHGRPLSVVLTGGTVHERTMSVPAAGGRAGSPPAPEPVIANKGNSRRARRTQRRRRGTGPPSRNGGTRNDLAALGDTDSWGRHGGLVFPARGGVARINP